MLVKFVCPKEIATLRSMTECFCRPFLDKGSVDVCEHSQQKASPIGKAKYIDEISC